MVKLEFRDKIFSLSFMSPSKSVWVPCGYR